MQIKQLTSQLIIKVFYSPSASIAIDTGKDLVLIHKKEM